MNIPVLRFNEFSDEWSEITLKNKCSFFSGGTPKSSNKSFYSGDIPFIGSGNIYDESVDSFINEDALKNSSAKLVNKGDILYALYGANSGDVAISKMNGAINQAILCIRPKEINTYFLKSILEFKKDKIVSTYLQGGQGNLSSQIVKKLKYKFPSLPEQQKIASFLGAVDKRIELLTKKKDLLEEYKKGVMQKLFSQEIRFKDENGNDYPDWEEKKLGEVLLEHKTKSSGAEEVFSVSVRKGLINQIEHLGRSFAAKNTDHYNLVKNGDIVYTKSPTGDFPYGIIKQSHIKENVIVSPLYGVFTPETYSLGYILNVYFESKINVHNYLHSIIQKGAKNTINITNNTFLSKKMKLPVDKKEQQKIANFLEAVDQKVKQTSQQLDGTKTFKKGLLQKMFV